MASLFRKYCINPADCRKFVEFRSALRCNLRLSAGDFSILPFDPANLSPLPGDRVAEIAGAEERIERLGNAREIGVHASCDVPRRVGTKCGDQPHRDRPEQQKIHDIEKTGSGPTGPGIGRLRFCQYC